MTFYKAVTPEGKDFFSGTIDYLAGGEIRHPDAAARQGDDPRGYLSVSVSPTDCTGFRWPARLLEVEPVGDVWAPSPGGMPNKRAVRALRVVKELDAKLLLGPQAEHLIALVERARALTKDEARALDAAWAAAWAAAWYVAWDAAWYVAWAAAWAVARDAAWAAARDAASGLISRDLVGKSGFTQERYDLLTGPWRRIIGPIHPEDVDLREQVTP